MKTDGFATHGLKGIGDYFVLINCRLLTKEWGRVVQHLVDLHFVA